MCVSIIICIIMYIYKHMNMCVLRVYRYIYICMIISMILLCVYIYICDYVSIEHFFLNEDKHMILFPRIDAVQSCRLAREFSLVRRHP